jgi:hypothetical protein
MMIKTMTTVGVTALLLVACTHEDRPAVSQPSLTGAVYSAPISSPAMPVGAAMTVEIAATTCDHEQACNNFGTDRTYATREVCIGRVWAEKQQQITDVSCPNGVSRLALDKCLSDIRGERCRGPGDKQEGGGACTREVLCQ